MKSRYINCQCGAKHWSTCQSEVKIKCRCGQLVILTAIENTKSSGVFTFK